MPNPYTAAYAPSTGDLSKTLLNAQAQRQFQNAMLQQQAQLAAQAGQTQKTQSASPFALADALRRMNKTQWSPNQIAEIQQLGSSLAPWSDYMTGRNGWGNYGE